MTTIDLYAPITKREKDPATGFVTVYGKMTGPDVDLDEQRMDPAWLAKAVPEWFETGANVREMHKTSAVGKGIELEQIGDDWYLKSLVVDAEAIKKVEAGVYNGYSIVVRGPRIVKDAQARGGRIVGGMIPETSLVDRPCLSSAKFLLAKAVGGAIDELEPVSIAGYLLTKDAGEMDTEGDVDGETAEAAEVDLVAIARDALNQWLAAEAAEVVDGKGGRMVVRLICDILSNLDWAVEADTYDDANAALEAVKTLLTTPAQEAEDMIKLASIVTLTKAATAEDASDDDRTQLADLQKALGIVPAEEITTIVAEVTKANASAEDLEKVALRLAKVETTAMTNGPTRVPTQHDTQLNAARSDTLHKVAEFRRLASTVQNRDQAASYKQLADELEATIPTV